MSILFTPGEIFDIAIEIERNGAAFYRKAAAHNADAEVRRELTELAAMEDGHEATFTEMKRDLVGNEEQVAWFDVECDAVTYLQNFADGQVFDLTKSPGAFPAATASLPETLRFALDRERDSVVFFLGMRELMPAADGRSKVDSIIKQEMGHITLLGRRLLEVSGRE